MLVPMHKCKSYYAAWLLPLIVINLIGVQAQQPSPTPAPSLLPTSASNSTIASSSRPVNTTFTSIFATTLLPLQPRPSGASSQQSIFLTTATITSSISYLSPTTNATVSATPTGPPPQTVLPLKTVIDPAFGILGALLIISGIVLSFIGHRSRWLICLLCGFYTLGLVTLCIILRVGVSRAVNDPSNTVKGLYLLACLVAGCVGGGLFVIFRNGGLLLSAGLGGFALALFFQACKSNGMIQTVGIRYILYIILAAISFALACHSKLQPYVLIFSSALIGATAFTFGVDCFTKANLKEFYIRNVGFDDLFEAKYPDEFRNHRWFLSSASVIELGVLGGMTIMGIAFQSKMWSEFRTSLIAMRNSDEERQLQAKAKRATKKVLASAQKDLREWEVRHGYRKTAGKAEADEESSIKKEGYMTEKPAMHEHRNSSKSLLPLSSDNDRDIPQYPTVLTKGNHPWMPPVEKEYRPAASHSASASRSSTNAISPEQKRLLDEIAAIRQSIDVLKTVAPSGGDDHRSSTDHTLSDPISAVERSKMVAPRWEQPRAEKVRSRIEFSGRSSNSPWIKTDRPRSQSVSTPATTKPSAPPPPVDFFAEGHNLIPSKYQVKTPAPPLHISIPSGTQSVGEASSGISRQRSTSDANHFTRSPMAYPHSASASHSRFASIDMMRRADSRTSDRNDYSSARDHDTSHHRMEGFYTPKNVYRNLQSDGGGSEVGSVIRFDARRSSPPPMMPRAASADQHGKKSSPSRPKKKASLSIEELQARHQSLLKAKQTPTSARFEEEAALRKAQEQWELKKKMDKRYWEERERQVQELSRMKSQSSSGRVLPPPERSPSAASRLDQVPEQSGISRAKEWRRSLILDDSEKVISSNSKKQRRHSSQILQPLLDFTAETMQQEGRNKMLRQQ